MWFCFLFFPAGFVSRIVKNKDPNNARQRVLPQRVQLVPVRVRAVVRKERGELWLRVLEVWGRTREEKSSRARRSGKKRSSKNWPATRNPHTRPQPPTHTHLHAVPPVVDGLRAHVQAAPVGRPGRRGTGGAGDAADDRGEDGLGRVLARVPGLHVQGAGIQDDRVDLVCVRNGKRGGW